MIYMIIFMFVRVLYPENLLHFAVAVVFETEGRRARPPIVSSRVHEMKRCNNAFYDAEGNAKLVGHARFRVESHPLWITTHDTQFLFFHMVLYFCTSTKIYLVTSHRCRCDRDIAHANAKNLHEAGSSFGRGR